MAQQYRENNYSRSHQDRSPQSGRRGYESGRQRDEEDESAARWEMNRWENERQSPESWEYERGGRGGPMGAEGDGWRGSRYGGEQQSRFGQRQGLGGGGNFNTGDSRSGGYGAGGYGAGGYGGGGYGNASTGDWGTGRGQSYGQQGMGREGGHRGKGPKGYQRSDERLKEVICEALSDDPMLDASNITVTVKNGEVTLEGSVYDRRSKHRAEDLVDDCGGVKEVRNTLRVEKSRGQWGESAGGNATGGGPGSRSGSRAGSGTPQASSTRSS